MKFGAIVTDAGTRRNMDAVHEGKKVNIVDFAVGDGGGVPCTPDAASTELVNELWRGLSTHAISVRNQKICW